ncbi:MAG: toprim domain-containing protein [Thermoplasmata archaeon]|nr:toprim domain-containing protein [Thermoplasmata archaeon]
MMSPIERFERIMKLIDELEELSGKMPVVVEGLRDIRALKLLGVERNVVSLSKGMSILAFCEFLSKEWSSAVILTDWDRKGGRLARKLKEAFEASGVKPVVDVRTQLAYLAKKEVKDIESLPTYVRRLRTMTESR